MSLKQKIDQEQTWSGRVAADYDDTPAAGAGMETPSAANQNLLWDVNNIRAQIARIMGSDWHQSMAALPDQRHHPKTRSRRGDRRQRARREVLYRRLHGG